VGCDVFVLNENQELLLIKRADNGFWALPGGTQDFGESAAQTAVRECFEETGYEVRLEALLGVFSSQAYPYVNFPWTENEYTHLLFQATLVGGSARPSAETPEVKWFAESQLPELSDGHDVRISLGFARQKNPSLPVHFE
jgi:ADP-ribose pyrophosphatase YjhB (NUDIX family)